MEKTETMKIELTFTEGFLGTTPGDAEIFTDHIASKAPKDANTDEELAAINGAEEIEKSSTIFPKDPGGRPFIWDYQVKGFFKDACGMLRRVDGTASKKIKAYKKVIDGLVFVEPRRIHLGFPPGAEIGICERPLRAQTPQGERVCLARSEEAPVGTVLHFSIVALTAEVADAIEEWLDYGSRRGLGQWRNSGKGRFVYKLISD